MFCEPGFGSDVPRVRRLRFEEVDASTNCGAAVNESVTGEGLLVGGVAVEVVLRERFRAEDDSVALPFVRVRARVSMHLVCDRGVQPHHRDYELIECGSPRNDGNGATNVKT